MLKLTFALLLSLTPTLASAAGPVPSPPPTAAAKSSPNSLVFESKLVDGKKTWLPAIATVKSGHMIVAKLVNTFPEPHGFEISGVSKVEVAANSTQVVTLEGLKKGETYDVKCHLHPAHVGAKLKVE